MEQALQSTIDLGISRFRIMSYWNIYEPTKGNIDFTLLDKQIAILKANNCTATLTIGMRQPRWPETHIPQWASKLNREQTIEAYIIFHKTVIERYKNEPIVQSWQLENEFWLRSFGINFGYSRKRLVREFNIIRELDPERPIIMSTAKFLSLPLLRPTPDIYATSIYRVIYNDSKQKYTTTWISPWMHTIKSFLIRITKRRGYINHELQTEPWGPKANWEMTIAEQDKSMNPENIKKAVQYANDAGMSYKDLWGAEWWYWRKTKFNDPSLQDTVKKLASKTQE